MVPPTCTKRSVKRELLLQVAALAAPLTLWFRLIMNSTLHLSTQLHTHWSCKRHHISSTEIVNGNGSIDGSALMEITGTAAAVVQAITDLDTDPSNFHSTLIGSADAVDIALIEAANGTGTIDGYALMDIMAPLPLLFRPSLISTLHLPTSTHTFMSSRGKLDITSIEGTTATASSTVQPHRH